MSSGWRKARQLLEPPKPKEFDKAARMGRRLDSRNTRFTWQLGSGLAKLALTGAIPSRMARAHTPASTAPAAAIRWPMQLLVELTATCSMREPMTVRKAAHSLRSFIKVEVPWALT